MLLSAESTLNSHPNLVPPTQLLPTNNLEHSNFDTVTSDTVCSELRVTGLQLSIPSDGRFVSFDGYFEPLQRRSDQV